MDINNLSAEQLAAVKAMLRKQARVKTSNGLSVGIGEKGAVCIYGLGRFPVTLYSGAKSGTKGQWEKLVDAVAEINAFIDAHKDELSVKVKKTEEEAA